MAEHNNIGKIGEHIGIKYLKKRGFLIVERNFHVKRGEIDIIATKPSSSLHVKPYNKLNNIIFVEVKTKKVLDFKIIKDLAFSPENNLTNSKRQRMKTAIRHYLSYRKIKEGDIDIKVMALIIYLNPDIKQAKVKLYEDFIL